MRTLFCLAIALPAMIHAQINRSAAELAKENIRTYLTGKIFKDASYQPISYGELKPEKERNEETKWIIVHKFKITETELEVDKKVSVEKPCDFIFYLDNRMQVIRARSYFESE